jgi:hypothetical protein
MRGCLDASGDGGDAQAARRRAGLEVGHRMGPLRARADEDAFGDLEGESGGWEAAVGQAAPDLGGPACTGRCGPAADRAGVADQPVPALQRGHPPSGTAARSPGR